jgi:hypothetical protein
MNTPGAPIVILDGKERVLYGHDVLERINQSNEPERVFVVRNVELERFMAMLKICFSDFQCVAVAVSLDTINSNQLRRISETIELTQEHVDMLVPRNL